MPVYFITEERDPDIEPRRVKIGYSNNIGRRTKQLQTGNSDPLLLMAYIQTHDPVQERAIEKGLHEQYKSKRFQGEWFCLYPSDVMDALTSYSTWGYLSCNGQEYEITGYDRDGIPEYASPWQWGDFDHDEFCPSCGWACGWSYNENYGASRCLQCGASEHDYMTG